MPHPVNGNQHVESGLQTVTNKPFILSQISSLQLAFMDHSVPRLIIKIRRTG